jgi:hypothetical protein
MDWGVFASVLAALAAIIVAVGELAKPAGDHVWYKRWLEVAEHTHDDQEREIARERIHHYVIEFAIADRTRKDRRFIYGAGVFLILVAIYFLTAGVTDLQKDPPDDVRGTWSLVGAAAAYVLGLYLLLEVPGRLRRTERRRLDGSPSTPSTPEDGPDDAATIAEGTLGNSTPSGDARNNQ